MPEVSEGHRQPVRARRAEARRGAGGSRGELAPRGYDQAIVLPNSFKSALIPRFAGIRLRTGFVGEVAPGSAQRRAPARRRCAAADGRALRRTSPTPGTSRCSARCRRRRCASRQTARDALLARLGLRAGPPVACLCPGAEYGPAKRWPAEHFASLAVQLAARGWQVWLIGSAKDRAIGAQIEQLSGGRCRNLCGSHQPGGGGRPAVGRAGGGVQRLRD